MTITNEKISSVTFTQECHFPMSFLKMCAENSAVSDYGGAKQCIFSVKNACFCENYPKNSLCNILNISALENKHNFFEKKVKKVLVVMKNALLLQSQTMRDGGDPEGVGRGQKVL